MFTKQGRLVGGKPVIQIRTRDAEKEKLRVEFPKYVGAILKIYDLGGSVVAIVPV